MLNIKLFVFWYKFCTLYFFMHIVPEFTSKIVCYDIILCLLILFLQLCCVSEQINHFPIRFQIHPPDKTTNSPTPLTLTSAVTTASEAITLPRAGYLPTCAAAPNVSAMHCRKSGAGRWPSRRPSTLTVTPCTSSCVRCPTTCTCPTCECGCRRPTVG